MPTKDMGNSKFYINENGKMFEMANFNSIEAISETDCENSKDFENINLCKGYFGEFRLGSNKMLFQTLLQIHLPNNWLKMHNFVMKRRKCKKGLINCRKAK